MVNVHTHTHTHNIKFCSSLRLALLATSDLTASIKRVRVEGRFCRREERDESSRCKHQSGKQIVFF